MQSEHVHINLYKKWLWLAGIWGISVISLGVVSMAFRLLMKAAGLTL